MQASTAAKQAARPAADAAADELAQALWRFVTYVMRTSAGDFLQRVDELELSLSQLKALQLLGERDESSLKALGDQLHLSLPAISRAVDGLVRRELVTRTEDADDRRMKRVAITAAGREVRDQLIQLRAEDLAAFLASLPARDRARLAAALRPIVAREEVVAALGPERRTR
jgi:DNA-binding MarR family transcriptional regulator